MSLVVLEGEAFMMCVCLCMCMNSVYLVHHSLKLEKENACTALDFESKTARLLSKIYYFNVENVIIQVCKWIEAVSNRICNNFL